MFKFNTPQKIYDIGGIKIGGQPGELPTTLIGSIFYEGQKMVEDPKKGVFDRARAEELIGKQEEPDLPNPNQASIVFDVSNTPGSLFTSLKYMADCKLNMKKLGIDQSLQKPFSSHDLAELIQETFAKR